MKLIIWAILVCNIANASFEQCGRQVQSSMQERLVTVKMLEDRIKCVERRASKIENIIQGITNPPDDIIDQLDQLRHDKRSLTFVINSMKDR